MELRRGLKNKLEKKFGKDLARFIEGELPIPGVFKEENSLYRMSSVSLHRALINIVNQTLIGAKINIKNSLIPLMFDYKGNKILLGSVIDDFKVGETSILGASPENASLFVSYLPNDVRNVVPGPFIIKDKFTLLGTRPGRLLQLG